MRIEYIEKTATLLEPETVGLKWIIDQKSYGAWKIKEDERDDFHFLISAAYWWSMYNRNWLVRLWIDALLWIRRKLYNE